MNPCTVVVDVLESFELLIIVGHKVRPGIDRHSCSSQTLAGASVDKYGVAGAHLRALMEHRRWKYDMC